ncbi:MAG: hypothetical protein HOW73_29450 [Polyangiaceae bacterium]|nr:hypothetical protein [Polyangiaceae bacterium]
MGISLRTQDGVGPSFEVNFWHWRALVEAIRRTGAIAVDRVEGLHEPFCGNGLTEQEARLVADALEAQVLPVLEGQARLLLDGSTTSDPDDGTLYKGVDSAHNYSTNRDILLKFVRYLRACSGFEVL